MLLACLTADPCGNHTVGHSCSKTVSTLSLPQCLLPPSRTQAISPDKWLLLSGVGGLWAESEYQCLFTFLQLNISTDLVGLPVSADECHSETKGGLSNAPDTVCPQSQAWCFYKFCPTFTWVQYHECNTMNWLWVTIVLKSVTVQKCNFHTPNTLITCLVLPLNEWARLNKSLNNCFERSFERTQIYSSYDLHVLSYSHYKLIHLKEMDFRYTCTWYLMT